MINRSLKQQQVSKEQSPPVMAEIVVYIHPGAGACARIIIWNANLTFYINKLIRGFFTFRPLGVTMTVLLTVVAV